MYLLDTNIVSYFFDSSQDLLDLIGLCVASVILDVNPWVPGPWSLADTMAATGLSRGPEKMFTYFAEVREKNTSWVLSHSLNY